MVIPSPKKMSKVQTLSLPLTTKSLVFFQKVGIRTKARQELGSRATTARAVMGEGQRVMPGESTRALAMTTRRGTLLLIITDKIFFKFTGVI